MVLVLKLVGLEWVWELVLVLVGRVGGLELDVLVLVLELDLLVLLVGGGVAVGLRRLAGVRCGCGSREGDDRFWCGVVLLQSFCKGFLQASCPHAGAGYRVPSYLFQDGD